MTTKNYYENNRLPQGGIIIAPPFMWPNPGNMPPFQNYPPFKPNKPDKEVKVKIKSVFEDEFVVVDKGYLYATGEKVNKNGIFKLVFTDGNRVKIRLEGERFIRLDEKDFLVADTNKKGATKFLIYKENNREYSLKAPNGYFVRVREQDKRLVARAEKPGPRTKFKFRVVE